MKKIICISLLLFGMIGFSNQIQAQGKAMVTAKIDQVEKEVIAWRRHFHEFPELSNREFKTGKKIAEILTEMGIEVETGVAKTGVIGLIKGGKPGPTVGLRADIDGLPVTERAPIDFASKERAEFLGEEVGVMHACGHDTHIAMLLGAAKVLNDMKDQIKGNIVLMN